MKRPTLVPVALALGLRQCEALGMRWEYLDLKAGTVRVYQLKKSRYQHGCGTSASRRAARRGTSPSRPHSALY